jgi:FkbM family methyltransferase
VSAFEFAKWFPNYLKAFGIVRGCSLFLRAALALARGGDEALSIRVPGLPRPVWLRPALGDFSIFQQIFVKREYDISSAVQFRRVEQAYARMVSRGERPLIIDCGAHVGLAALWFRARFPAASIVCVEPNPANIEMLRRNLTGIEGITVLEGGIWNRSAALRLTNAEGGMAGFRLAPAEDIGSAGVSGFTIDEILSRSGVPGALIVKVDIEGGEAALFDGEAAWLDRIELLVIELHDWLFPWQGTSDSFFARMGERRFDHHFRGENLFCFRRPSSADSPEAVA